MKYDISPVETVYNGTRFRSRLEARWAVFFDAMGLRWKYEPNPFQLTINGDTRVFVPDYYLPDFEVYAEVKPSWEYFSGDTLEKCLALCRLNSHYYVLLLDGLPDFKAYRVMTAEGMHPNYSAVLCNRPHAGNVSYSEALLRADEQYIRAINRARRERFNAA